MKVFSCINIVVVAACLALFGVALAERSAITPCTKDGKLSAATDILQATAYHLIPKSPKAGDTITGSFEGTITQEITSGKIWIDVTLNGILPIRQNLSLSLVDDIRRQLPIPKGPFSLQEHATLPGFLFGEVKGTIKLLDQNNKQITCLHVDILLGD
eukprot:CFRG0489T1